MNTKEIIEILDSRWGQGFLFVILFVVVMFAVSSAQMCDINIAKAVEYVRTNECNCENNIPLIVHKNPINISGNNVSR